MLVAERFISGLVNIPVSFLFQMMETHGIPPKPAYSSNNNTIFILHYEKSPIEGIYNTSRLVLNVLTSTFLVEMENISLSR